MGKLEDIGKSRDSINRRLAVAVHSDREKARRAEHVKRNEFYRDGGDRHMTRYIDLVFKDEETKELRKVFIEWAKGNNVTRRIVKEKSTVYKEEPRRTLGYDGFKELQAKTLMNLVMREADRMVSLHNDVLIGPRMRIDASPVLDLVTPDLMSPLIHPNDHTLAQGWVVHQGPPDPAADPREPHGRLWCDDFTVKVDADGAMIGAPLPNPFGRIPFVHVADVPPSARGMLLDSESGRDITATHENVWFQGILHLKESKSSTTQTYFSGDLSTTSTGQSQDSESDLILGEGVSPGTIDRGTDQKQFRDNADHMLERAAGNHGIAPGILRHDGASSGFEIALRRIPIRELRQERIPIWRLSERLLVDLMGVVFGFEADMDSFAIDFGEVETPMSPSERVDVFVKERQASLVTTTEEIQRRNPDLDDAAALKKMMSNVTSEGTRVVLVNENMSGSFGANNAPKDDDDDESRLDA